jgi:hypothetical protein
MDLLQEIGDVSLILLEKIISNLDDSDLKSLLSIREWLPLLNRIKDRFWRKRGARNEIIFHLLAEHYDFIDIK